MTAFLRFYVLVIFYMVNSFQVIAWKYQTKDVYFRFRRRGRALLVAMHGTIVLTNIVLFPTFIAFDWHQPIVGFLRPLGLAVMLSGTSFFTWAFSILRWAALAPKEESQLIAGGPFRYVRHPMYLGGILAAFGLATAAGSMLGLVYSLALALVLADIATAEERDLIDRFGEQYVGYMRKVPRLNPLLFLIRRLPAQ